MSQGFARHGMTDSLSKTGTWARQSDWLALPSITALDEKIVAIHAVGPADNWCAFTCTGNYTVDWGDGDAAENVASGVTVYHNFAWADYADSTLTSRGYRQAIVTITPQDGASLVTVNFYVKHNQSGLPNGYTTGWLDMAIALPNCTTFTFGSTTGSTVIHAFLEQFTIVSAPAMTSCANMMAQCRNLRHFDDDSGTFGALSGDFQYMFHNCSSLSTIPLIDTSSGTSFANMFQNCSSLSTIPLIDTSSGTSFASMFYNCPSLSTIPLIDTSSGTSFASMFYNCSSLSVGATSGAKYSISYASCRLNSTQLDAIYTNLGTAESGQSVTVTGNYGTSGDDPSIATAKGWTVTGS